MKNDHIVVNIHPFVIQQEVDVYSNGECVQTVECKLDELKDTIFALSKQHNIQQIDLAGNQLYAMRLRDDLGAGKYATAGMSIKIH